MNIIEKIKVSSLGWKYAQKHIIRQGFVENNVRYRSIMRADDHAYGLFESFAG